VPWLRAAGFERKPWSAKPFGTIDHFVLAITALPS
jgi:hypothetical protein